MGWLWLVVGAVGLGAAALAAAAALRPSTASSFALGCAVLASAELILLGEALSLLRAVGVGGYLVGEALLLAASLAAWHLRGRPRPPLPPRLDLPAAARRHPVLAALALAVALGLAYELFLVLATPPDNWDSMTYHLPRVVEWLQRGGIQYVPDAATQRVNAYQPGSELEILWSFALLHRDTVAAVPQLLAGVVSIAAVYAIARRLGSARPAAAFAGLLTATLTEVALQSVTTQNDLLCASFVAAAAALLLARERAEVGLAAVAYALALGTKLTAIFALPILLGLALAVLPRRRLAEAVAAAAAAFLLFGFYGYALNLVETGRLLGDPSASEAFRPGRVTWDGTVSTVARVGFRFVDLSGFHPKTAVTDWISRRGRDVFHGLDIPANPPESSVSFPFDFKVGQEPNEDLSYFGPLGFLLVLPLAAAFALASLVRRRRPELLALAVALPLVAFEVALTYRYNVWLGRFMVTPVVLTMPLAAWLYRSRVAAGAAAVVGAASLAVAHAYNHAKPTGLDGTRAVWSLPRAEAMAATRTPMAQVIAGVERHVPARARLGVVVGADDWVYPLYGPRLERRLVHVGAFAVYRDAKRENVHWIVVNGDESVPPPRRNWYRERYADSGWTLLLHPEELPF